MRQMSSALVAVGALLIIGALLASIGLALHVGHGALDTVLRSFRGLMVTGLLVFALGLLLRHTDGISA